MHSNLANSICWRTADDVSAVSLRIPTRHADRLRWAPSLRYELAFGGTWEDDEQQVTHEQNPVGIGFVPRSARRLPDRIAAPQIEDPANPVTEFRREYAPVGFGPIAKHWMPRRQLCGTADESWKKNRWPLRPVDFDFNYYQCASPGLIYPEYLRGNEEVLLTGLSTDGPIQFRLPETAITVFGLRQSGGILLESMVLDTLHIDTESMQLSLTWRLTIPGELDFSMIQLVPEPLPSPTSKV